MKTVPKIQFQSPVLDQVQRLTEVSVQTNKSVVVLVVFVSETRTRPSKPAGAGATRRGVVLLQQ